MVKSSENSHSLDAARRQESKAYNDLEYRSQQADEQKSQLDILLEHRNNCMEGLANARETGLTPVHVREYQLLMKHIDAVVEAIEYKVNASQDNLDKAQEVWQKKKECFVKAKEVANNNTTSDNKILPEEENEETSKEMKILVKKDRKN